MLLFWIGLVLVGNGVCSMGYWLGCVLVVVLYVMGSYCLLYFKSVMNMNMNMPMHMY